MGNLFHYYLLRSGALCSIVPWLSQCWLLLLSDPGCRAILQFATLPLLVLSVSAIGGILTPSIDYLAYNSRQAMGTYSLQNTVFLLNPFQNKQFFRLDE